MDKEIEFAKRIIKGKIAELVFEFMFRSAGQYTVVPFGYEMTRPELAQHLNLLEGKGILDTLRDTPDFILISNDKKEVFFVEVKYERNFSPEWIKKMAEKTVSKWDHAYIFLATPEGFYYEPCHSIINKNGAIGKLYESHVSKELQSKYLQLLNEFEK